MHDKACIDCPVTNGEDMSPPAANNGLSTATVLNGLSTNNGPSTATVLNGLSTGTVGSGMDLAPMDRVMEIVNENLRDCPCCKGSKLKLEHDKRVGFASNYKLTCTSCKKKEVSLENTVHYLKRKVGLCKDFKTRRSVKKALYKKRESFRKQKKIRTDRRIASPHLELTSDKKRHILWIIMQIFVLY